MQVVLGIHIGHDSSICLIIDGKIKFALQEERFSRIKNHTGYPFKSLEYIKGYLKKKSFKTISLAVSQNNLTQDIDLNLPLLISRLIRYKYPKVLRSLIIIFGKFYDLFFKKSSLNEVIWRKLLIFRTNKLLKINFNKVMFFDHHKCHAASAAFSSGFNDCLVFTQDGKGDLMSGSAWHFKNKTLKNIYYQKEADSIGQIYAEVTRFLGFRPNRHEGKVTGLAARGDSDKYLNIFDNLTKLDKNYLIKRSNNSANYNNNARFLQKIFKNNLDKIQRSNISASLQRAIEKILINHLEKIIKKPSNIALAGGLFANVKINQEVRNSKKCKNLFVQPAMTDCGLSMGAAQLMNVENGIENIFESSALIGNSYSKSYIKKELMKLSFDYEFIELGDNVFCDIAFEISKGKIVGIFQGKMEWGPRALSSRSILANPRKLGINKELNIRLNRSDFMPFAPVVLDEDMEELFLDWNKNDRTSQYMTSTYNVNRKFEGLMPAVVHVDKTARPQTVSKKEYPFLYRVLKEIKKLSGIGVTINTSFNLHEEPIVQSPKDALIGLKKNAIDILYFESLKVKLKETKS